MAALGPGIFQGLVALFLYAVPAASVHLMVRGLANPAYERWTAPDEAAVWKARYRRWAGWALLANRLLFGIFAVRLVALLALRVDDCVRHASHLSAAAWNLEAAMDKAFVAVFIALFVFALAGIVWSATYLFRARQAGWADPRRKDPLIVHVVIIPLALVLMAVAFSVLHGMVCG